MDAEPGRCRRTDGQKWRCRLAVLPDQKYCERHVHRGRHRSRKPVEVNQTLLKTSISAMKAAPKLESAAKTSARKDNKVGVNNQSHKIKKHSTENARTPLESCFLPGSDLQRDNVRVHGTSNNHNSSVVAVAESVRCKRTDGKKWRCSKEVIPDQKYCMQHMYRGVKMVEDNNEKSNNSLSFSVGASNQQSGDNVNPSNDDNGSDANGATTSCGSDATTISN